MATLMMQHSVTQQIRGAIAALMCFCTLSCHASDVTELFAPGAGLPPIDFPTGQQPSDQAEGLRIAFLGNTLIHRDA